MNYNKLNLHTVACTISVPHCNVRATLYLSVTFRNLNSLKI